MPQYVQLSALLAFLVVGPLLVCAQSQALNGQIEGVVFDQNGAAVQNAAVLATNLETGAVRTSVADERGVFRFPLVLLGTYRISVEAVGFKKTVRDGITLVAGQTATVDFKLEPGAIEEVVTVSYDTPIADTGKTDLGRVMNSREVHNIPLPTRNPYNFIILQANVTGRPNRGFFYPQVNVNGFARRVNYLLDGNTNTRGDIAGARLLFISNTYVNEIQLVTNGFAPEFGNTTGMIMNIVTPSGTNDLRGSIEYLFRRPPFYARPFFFSAAKLPDSFANNVAGKIGGPFIRDRWHFYFGYEWLDRVDNTRGLRQVTISEADKASLIAAGLSASIFVPAIPSLDEGAYYIFRTDAQLTGNNRLTARFNHARENIRSTGSSGFNTLERSVDTQGIDHSLGLQLVSLKAGNLNEFRFQYARSKIGNLRNEASGTGPSITVMNVANFGSPTGVETLGVTRISQIQDNLTLTRGSHAVKLGGGFSHLDNFDRAARLSQYTFPSIAAYATARSGADPFSYTRYEESFGDPEIRNASTFWNFFVQDDWKVTRRLKFNFGIRYDVYLPPEADSSSPFAASRRFNIDKNNIAPRFGVVYALREGDRPLVIRAGAGFYYEPPWLGMYRRALLTNGNPRFFSLRFLGNNNGRNQRDPLAPAFPTSFSGSHPPGSILPRQDIVTVAPDFESMYAVHANVQIEQALTEDLSLAVGFVRSGGRHIPVYRSINAITPVRFLADRRPVFGPERLDPRFNIIQMAESAGVSRYDALTLQLTQRLSRGVQFSANYTLSRAIDDAPEQEVTYSDGNRMLRALSDPTNRALDKGYSYGDQRHTFVMSLVARPNFSVGNKAVRYLLNDNQFGVITTANSGERFNINAGVDLNGDGLFFPDRPVGIKRNSGKTPPQFNLDLRYSRFVNFTERYRLEIFGEVQNLFNINSIIGYGNVVVPIDPTTGEMIGPIPDFKARNTSFALESRQLQVGLKFIF